MMQDMNIVLWENKMKGNLKYGIINAVILAFTFANIQFSYNFIGSVFLAIFIPSMLIYSVVAFRFVILCVDLFMYGVE